MRACVRACDSFGSEAEREAVLLQLRAELEEAIENEEFEMVIFYCFGFDVI